MENKELNRQMPFLRARKIRDENLQRKIEKNLLRKTFEVFNLIACKATCHLPGLTEINGKIKIVGLETGDDNRIIQALFQHDNEIYRINGDRFVKIPEIKKVITKVKDEFYGRN